MSYCAPQNHAWIEALEQSIHQAADIGIATNGGDQALAKAAPTREKADALLDARLKATLKKAEAMSPEDYRTRLHQRAAAQQCHSMLAPLADAIVMLSCPGPAPLWPGDVPGQPLAPRPTGDSIFNTPSSMLFAPAVTMPLLSVDGMPVGVQLMGQQHEDARITAARAGAGNRAPGSQVLKTISFRKQCPSEQRFSAGIDISYAHMLQLAIVANRNTARLAGILVTTLSSRAPLRCLLDCGVSSVAAHHYTRKPTRRAPSTRGAGSARQRHRHTRAHTGAAADLRMGTTGAGG